MVDVVGARVSTVISKMSHVSCCYGVAVRSGPGESRTQPGTISSGASSTPFYLERLAILLGRESTLAAIATKFDGR